MKVLYLIPVMVLWGLSAKPQLSGNKSIPGDYPDLTAAITDLNNQGPGNGGVTFNVFASQTAPVGGYTLTASGTFDALISFQGNGNIVYGTGGAGNMDGIFKLAGSDYITINNFILTGDATVEWGIALLKRNSIAPYDGCSYNNLTNLTITLNKTNTASVGIYAAPHTAESTDILSVTSEAGDGTSNNNINGNIISNVYHGILFSGTTSFGPDVFNNFGSTTGNQISDYGGGSLPAYGIRLALIQASEIRNNSISLSDGNMADVYGIDVNARDVTIQNNVISMSGNIYNNSLTAINCGMDVLNAQLYNNRVIGCNVSAVSGTFNGIRIDNMGWATSIIEGNIINSNSLSGSGDMNLIYSTNCSRLSGNSLYDNSKSGASGSLYCIRIGSAQLILNNLVYSNSISSNSGTDSSKIYGIYATSCGSVVNNQIHNLSIAGAAAPVVSSIYGIYAAQSTDSIADNLIYNLDFHNSSGGSAIIKGIVSLGLLMRNRISDLNATAGTESLVYGIESGAGYIVNNGAGHIINNMVSNVHARAANSDNAVCGINITESSPMSICYNTILLNDTSTGSGFGSSAVSVSTASYVLLVDNILINKSASGAGGFTVAYRRSSPLLTSNGASNYNLYYADNPGPHNLIYYDGTNADQTLAAFKTRVSPNDSRSVTENTPFLSTDVSSYSFLHVSNTIPTLVESGGQNVSGVTRDIDREVRQGNSRYHGAGFAPDIGADEIEGRTLTLIDVGATTLSGPGLSCYGSLSQTVSIAVHNYGLSDISFATRPLTITVLVTGALTQIFTATITDNILASGESRNYSVATMYMISPGAYVFNAYTTLAGDTTSSNNAMPQMIRIVRPFADLPDSIDFNGYDGTNLAGLLAEWYEANGLTSPTGSTSLWNTQVGLGNPGNTSAKVNLHSSGHNEWIVGPKFWVTDSAEFKFDIAITAKDDISTPAVMGSDDTISVMVSEDCGRNWYPIRQFTAADLLSSTLTTQTISLYNLRSRILIIALKASDGAVADPEDYDVHIDNIVLNSPFIDLGIVSLVLPGLGCLSNAETVSIGVKNFSSVPIFLDPVFPYITIRVTGPVATTITHTLMSYGFVSIRPGETMNFYMPGYVNMSLPGIYRFDASVSIASDPDTSNNRLPAVFRTVWSTVALPLQVDFAGYDGDDLTTVFPGWSEGTGSSNPSGGESSWTNGSGLGSTGNVSAKVHLHSNTANEWIISPAIIAPASAIELKLKVALTEHGSLTNSAVMAADDKVSLMISSDCGANWISIKDFTAADALTPALTEFTIRDSSYAGQKILIALRATDGVIDDPNDYDFHVDDIRVQAVSFALPVELLSFSGQRIGNTNLLKWKTASEQNVKGFQVERSADAVHYDPVGFVNSQAPGGNSTVQLDYEFTDNSLTGDKQYYRLRQYDLDGKNKLSNVILIRNVNPATLALAGLYPNPASNKLLLEVQAPYRDAVKIDVVNSVGQIMKEKTIIVEKGINTIDLDVQSLIPGTYMLKLTTEKNKETIAGKFVKL